MEEKMIDKDTKKKIFIFEKDMNKALKQGYIISMNNINGKNAVEVLLPESVSSHQATKIARFIKNKYDLDACFFIKKHGINVYYEK